MDNVRLHMMSLPHLHRLGVTLGLSFPFDQNSHRNLLSFPVVGQGMIVKSQSSRSVARVVNPLGKLIELAFRIGLVHILPYWIFNVLKLLL